MGWSAYHKDGTITSEDKDGRPVQLGDEGKLIAIAQEDFGRKVVVDLLYGRIGINYEEIRMQNGSLEVTGNPLWILMLDGTNIIGDYRHLRQEYHLARDEKGRKIHDDNGKLVEARTDHLDPMLFRPIWFSRYINGMPVKAIGVQTTTPELQGARNIQLMAVIYPDGRIGIASEM